MKSFKKLLSFIAAVTMLVTMVPANTITALASGPEAQTPAPLMMAEPQADGQGGTSFTKTVGESWEISDSHYDTSWEVFKGDAVRIDSVRNYGSIANLTAVKVGTATVRHNYYVYNYNSQKYKQTYTEYTITVNNSAQTAKVYLTSDFADTYEDLNLTFSGGWTQVGTTTSQDENFKVTGEDWISFSDGSATTKAVKTAVDGMNITAAGLTKEMLKSGYYRVKKPSDGYHLDIKLAPGSKGTVPVAVYATDGSTDGRNSINKDLREILGIDFVQEDNYAPIGVIYLPRSIFYGKTNPYIQSQADWDIVAQAITEIDKSKLTKGNYNNTVGENLDTVQADIGKNSGSVSTALFDWKWGGESEGAIVSGTGKDFEYHLDLRFATNTVTYKVELQNPDGSYRTEEVGTRTYLTSKKLINPADALDWFLNIPEGYTITGYYYDKEHKKPVDFDNDKITQDTIMYIQLDKNDINVKIDLNGGRTTSFEGETHEYRNLILGKQFPTVATPTRANYIFDGWERKLDDGSYVKVDKLPTTVAQSAEYRATWKGGDFDYTIESYFEKVDGSYDKTSVTGKGKYGDTVTATAGEYAGFVYDADNSDNVTSAVIGDSTVLKLYYKRTTYKVSYAYADGSVVTDVALPGEATYKYGQSVTVASPISKTGYIFSGWSTENANIIDGKFDMPEGDVTIKGKFDAANVGYTVTIKQQNLDDDNYSVISSTKQPGNTGATASYTVNANAYTGFIYNADKSNTSATIAADGKTELVIYYDRATYTVSYAYTEDSVIKDEELPQSHTYKYGTEVDVAAKLAKQGYTFAWSESEKFTVTEDKTITGKFSNAKDTPYTVRHIRESMTKAGVYDVVEEVQESGTTNSEVTATLIKEYAGYEFDAKETGSKNKGVITADGKLVLEVYYSRKTYKVIYDYVGEQGADKTVDVRYGDKVTPTSDVVPGYTFNGWKNGNDPVNGEFTMPAHDVTLSGSYTANTNNKYVIEHIFENVTKTGWETETVKRDYNNGVTGETITASHETFTGFTPFTSSEIISEATGVVTPDGKLVLKVYYLRNTYTLSYKFNNEVAGASSLPTSVDYAYGAKITIADNATAPGYTFSGWNHSTGETMPASDLVVAGGFTIRNDIKYTVEYLFETVSGEYESMEAYPSRQLEGTAFAPVAVNEEWKLDVANFTFDSANPIESLDPVAETNNKITLKYTRNSFNVSYQYAEGTKAGASALPQGYPAKHGTELSLADDPTLTGYTFNGWVASPSVTVENGKFIMPTNNIVFTGSFSPAQVEYKVVNKLQNVDNDDYVTGTSVTLKATADSTVTIKKEDIEKAAPEGFEYKGGDITTTINADGTTVIEIQYDRKTFTVDYKYSEASVIDTEKLPDAISNVRYGKELTVATALKKAGYDFSWSQTGEFTVVNDTTIYGTFTYADGTKYTVAHYFEPISGGEYTERTDLRESLTGKTNDKVSGSEKTGIEGYEYDAKKTGSEASGRIEADGSLVLKLYYSRKQHSVSYVYTDKHQEDSTATYKYGDTVDVITAPEIPGYEFNGWIAEGASVVDGKITVPDGDVVFKGSYTAVNSAYTVEHYRQAVDGTYPELLKETENLQGTTDTEATATDKGYTGFTLDTTVSGTKESGIITGDGKLVLKLFYTRNTHKVTYKIGNDVIGTEDVKYEDTIPEGPNPTDIPAGYHFTEWTYPNGTMPNEDITVIGSYAPNTNTAYTIKHYTANIGGNGYTLYKTESKTGTTDTTVTAEPIIIEGFTYAPNADGEIISGTISGDETLVLELYYSRNKNKVTYKVDDETTEEKEVEYGDTIPDGTVPTIPDGYDFSGWTKPEGPMPNGPVEVIGNFIPREDTAYTIKYHFQAVEGNGYESDINYGDVVLQGTTDTTAVLDSRYKLDITGFIYKADNDESVTIDGDGSATIDLYYDRVVKAVSYRYINETLPEGTPALPETVSYRYGAQVTIAASPVLAGYTFYGWTSEEQITALDGKFTMPAYSVSLKGSYTANGNTAYKVEHYKQELDGNYSLADTDNLSGETATTAYATVKTYEGFTQNAGHSDSITSGVIAGNGSLVLKVYYDRNNYTLTYQYDGKVPNGASAAPEAQTLMYGQTINLAGAPTTPVGYDFSGWTIEQNPTTMPASDLVAHGSFNAKMVKYTVVHLKETLDGGYEVADTEEFEAETDTPVTATAKAYTHYNLVEGQNLGATVAGDGSTRIEVKYNRKTYTISYAYEGLVPEGATDAATLGGQYKYGTIVPVAVVASVEGYTFNNWGLGNSPADITVDGDKSFKGNYIPNGDTLYVVEHYFENVEGNDFIKDISRVQAFRTQTDALITVSELTVDGFTFDANHEGTVKTATIRGDGKTVFKLYYTRNIYNLTVRYVDIYGNTLAPSAKEAVKFGGETVIQTPSVAGYIPNYRSVKTPEGGMPAHDLTATVIFSAIPADEDAGEGITPVGPNTPAGPNTPNTPNGQNPGANIPGANNDGGNNQLPGNEIAINGEQVPAAGQIVVTPDGDAEIVEIEDEATALAGEAHLWALVNLIAMLISVLYAIYLLVLMFRKKKEEEEDETAEANVVNAEAQDEDEKKKDKKEFKLLAIATSIVSIVAFVLTENMRNPMRLTDKWTLLMIVLLAVEFVFAYFSRKKKQDEDEDETVTQQ